MASNVEDYDPFKLDSLVYSRVANEMKKGEYMLIKKNPCTVKSIATSKATKHVKSQLIFTGIDIFTGKEYEEYVHPLNHVICPKASKFDYQLLDIVDNVFLCLMEPDSAETREDLQLFENPNWRQVDENLFKEFKSLDDNTIIIVTVLRVMEKECIISYRKAAN